MCSPDGQRKNVTLHSSVSPRLPWQILGLPLSFMGLLSSPRMVYLVLLGTGPLWTGHYPTDLSWMVSFLDWCLSFLHAMTSHSTSRSSRDLTANYVSQSWMSHRVVLGRVLPSCHNRCYNPVNVSLLQYGQAVSHSPKSQTFF